MHQFISGVTTDRVADAAACMPCAAHVLQPTQAWALQEMIDEADRDGDGEVNEEEFFRIMKKTSLF